MSLLVVCWYFLLRDCPRFPLPPSKNLEAIDRGGRHLRVVSESSDVGADILYLESTNLDLGSGSGMAQNIGNQKWRIVNV